MHIYKKNMFIIRKKSKVENTCPFFSRRDSIYIHFYIPWFASKIRKLNIFGSPERGGLAVFISLLAYIRKKKKKNPRKVNNGLFIYEKKYVMFMCVHICS